MSINNEKATVNTKKEEEDIYTIKDEEQYHIIDTMK